MENFQQNSSSLRVIKLIFKSLFFIDLVKNERCSPIEGYTTSNFLEFLLKEVCICRDKLDKKHLLKTPILIKLSPDLSINELNENEFGQDLNGDGETSQGSTSSSADTYADKVQTGNTDSEVVQKFGNVAQSEIYSIANADTCMVIDTDGRRN